MAKQARPTGLRNIVFGLIAVACAGGAIYRFVTTSPEDIAPDFRATEGAGSDAKAPRVAERKPLVPSSGSDRNPGADASRVERPGAAPPANKRASGSGKNEKKRKRPRPKSGRILDDV